MVERLQSHAQQYIINLEGKEIILEVGKLAEQASGALTIRMGETLLFTSVVMNQHARDGLDFFPLSVDYEERMYAGGRIPGSFFRREGRPAESAILISRVVDRTLRPLFPKNMRNEVQVIMMSLSHDGENPVDMMGIVAASAALHISEVPWAGPVAGVRIGMIDGEFVVNPTYSEMENSTLDLRVSGTADAINMVECGAEEIDEDTVLEAMELAHKHIKTICGVIEQMREQIGKEKSEYIGEQDNDDLMAEVAGKVRERVRQVIAEQTERDDRNEAIEAIRDDLMAEYEARNAELDDEDAHVSLKHVREGLNKVVKEEVRRRILDEGIRPDGRDYTTIRALGSEVDLIPRVHGSGLFTRGQTQVLTITTLGTPRDLQELDGLSPQENKRYIHHYNFPPYSTGEAYPLRGTKRREVGHGALAETALRPMIPDEDIFPYTIRLVSEVMSSNGSTSMASVCGSTLSLMDAGVPIKQPVAGIAMGLIKQDEQFAVLTDIQGMEDHLGDMDFKVAGTETGITALQMDIKIKGISRSILKQAMEQARQARLQILEVMLEAIETPRSALKEHAPRMESISIDPEKIGAVIGPGGKVIRGIQEQTNAKIDIQEDGTVFIAADNGPAVDMAMEMIRGLTEDAEVGRIYTGKVTRIEPYGVFVEIMPGRDGMVHISQLADYRVNKVEDEVSMGDEIMVMVTDVAGGKIRLSRQAVMEGWTIEEARANDRGLKSGGGGRRRR